MVKFLIERPIAVIMTFIAAITLGIISYRMLPVSLMPDIPIPEITVQMNYSNCPARQLENTIVKPVRNELMQMTHLNEIKSETRDGIAQVKLRFDYGSNVDLSFIEANEKIDKAMNNLPRDMERPRVVKASTTDIPVFYLDISLKNKDKVNLGGYKTESDKFMELSEFADAVIRRRIEQLSEVAMVDISGTVNPEIIIEPNLNLLKNLNITNNQLENALVENNVNFGSYLIRDGHYQYNVRFSNVMRTRTDVENIYLNINNRIFQLKQLAQIKLQPQKRNGMVLSNGKPSITMAVIKQAEARMEDMKDQIHDLMEQFEKDYPQIKFEVSQDQTRVLDYSISNLIQNLAQGLILVTLVVFFFLKDLKSPLLVGLTLIISVIICMLFFYIFNLSINVISLSGLILAIGMMIDSSIVVTDNISQYREKNYPIGEACITGTNEDIIPVLSTSLTTVAVFVPLVFISGIAGAIFYDEAVSVTIGLGVAFIVAMTLLPVLYRLFYARSFKKSNLVNQLQKKNTNKIRFPFLKYLNVEKIYESGINFVFSHKRLTLITSICILPFIFILFWIIKKEKMPPVEQTELIIKLDWNENIHVYENEKRTSEMMKLVDTFILQSACQIGKQQFLLNREQEQSATETRIYINTRNSEKIKVIETEITRYLKKNYPKTKFEFQPPVSTFEKLFTASEPPLVAQLYKSGQNSALDINLLNQLNTDFNSLSGIKANNAVPIQEYISISVDWEKLLLYNVNYDALIKELKTAFNENYVTTLRSFQQFLPIALGSGNEKLLSEIIQNTKVLNQNNAEIPVNVLVKVSREQDLKIITAGKDGEYAPFIFFPTFKEKDEYIQAIKSVIKKNKDKELEVKFTGAIFTNEKMFKELSVTLLISVLLLYFILAAQFESLVQPFLVLFEIPVDIAASLFILLIFGQSLNLMSGIGLVIMSGIIINDSILKVDVINQLRKSGMNLEDAIKTGGHRRLRAIIMTCLTAVLDMMPLLFSSDIGSELQKPFAYALIGGMTFGTLVSLFVLPLAYWYIYRNHSNL